MQDFEDYLIEKYPDLFPKGENGKPRHSDCGVSCPVGWQDLIDKLCRSIDWHVKNGGKNETTNKISFGVYRFIWKNLKIGELFNSIEHSIDPVDWGIEKWRPSSEVDDIRKAFPKRTAFLKSFQRFKWNVMPKAKFRKKPVIIEASQLTPKSREEISLWVNEGESGASANKSGLRAWYYDSNGDGELYIETLEGTMTASDGDWIIKGVKGEFYPCKPDIFKATYEAVDSCENDLAQTRRGGSGTRRGGSLTKHQRRLRWASHRS